MARKNTLKPLPMMLAELSLASWETIWRRTSLMAQGACSAAEYQRMMAEKIRAAQISTLAMMTGAGHDAVLRPWHRRATANAQRLRRKA